GASPASSLTGTTRESPGEAFQVQGASPAAAPTGPWPAAQSQAGGDRSGLPSSATTQHQRPWGSPATCPPRGRLSSDPLRVRACMGGLRGGRAKASPRSCAVVLAESPRSAHRGRGRRALPPDPVTSSRCPAVTEQRGQRRGWPEQSGEPDRRSRPGGYPRPQRQAHARFAHHLTLGVKRAEAPGRRGRAGPAATWRQSVAAQPRAFRPNEGGAAHGSLPSARAAPEYRALSACGTACPAPSPRPAGKGRRAQRKRGERSREVSGQRRHAGPSNGEQRPTGSDPPPPRPPQGPRRGRRPADAHRARLPGLGRRLSRGRPGREKRGEALRSRAERGRQV
ncbi:LOW QUALITY PROTEIN: translation initiation factor IF-2, partial [Crotalus tigris]|uniref:LOW QUALITY PROTEIN: translation initiation factor IF-2 n=1 Tax=Crotalus tigris TaxID=88082 RepID=UPI00192F20CB